jgi:hypothetical protein
MHQRDVLSKIMPKGKELEKPPTAVREPVGGFCYSPAKA